jgi:hypothetical protein
MKFDIDYQCQVKCVLSGAANEKMLLFSRLNEIRAVYFDKSYYHAAAPISYPLIVAPANLHFVAKYKQVYWSDSQSGETKRASISNNTIETLIDSGKNTSYLDCT